MGSFAPSALVTGLAVAAALGGLGLPTSARAESPGLEAIKEFRSGLSHSPAIENRFFVKEARFEIAPQFGYVPNNPFAQRYVGAVTMRYHFNDLLAAGGTLSYSPDLGESDLKGLTRAAVVIARQGTGGEDFQQPLDKSTLGFNAGVTWSPLYGKINLVGETVLNFDLYGTAGLGMLSKTNYYAVYDEDAAQGETPVSLEKDSSEFKLTPVLGLGMNFFLNQSVALKLDTSMSFYIDNKPQYDRTEPSTEQQLYNNFVASVGMAFFVPNMKPRLYDF